MGVVDKNYREDLMDLPACCNDNLEINRAFCSRDIYTFTKNNLQIIGGLQ